MTNIATNLERCGQHSATAQDEYQATFYDYDDQINIFQKSLVPVEAIFPPLPGDRLLAPQHRGQRSWKP